MNDEDHVNPFSTKYWTAGVIPFRFSESAFSLDGLLEKAAACSVCQIVGPHGTGKSALLLSMRQRYEEQGNPAEYLAFTASGNVPHHITPLRTASHATLFVDGWEKLPLMHRYRLRQSVKRIILTAHKPYWFVPILYRTRPQFAVFTEIVRQIAPLPPDSSVLRSVFDNNDGHFRNAFFELYDAWEAQRQ